MVVVGWEAMQESNYFKKDLLSIFSILTPLPNVTRHKVGWSMILSLSDSHIYEIF